MTSYFENSQSIKKEIESRLDLKNKITMCLDDKIEPFSFGGTVNLYRIGKLKSGLYIALRRFRPEMVEGRNDLNTKKKGMEIYCQNAERLKNEGEEVPQFCVGVVNGNDAGILTEDLTLGGKFDFDHFPDMDFGFVVDGTNRRKVWVDIDHLFSSELGHNRNYYRDLGIKYFANEARIDLQ